MHRLYLVVIIIYIIPLSWGLNSQFSRAKLNYDGDEILGQINISSKIKNQLLYQKKYNTNSNSFLGGLDSSIHSNQHSQTITPGLRYSSNRLLDTTPKGTDVLTKNRDTVSLTLLTSSSKTKDSIDSIIRPNTIPMIELKEAKLDSTLKVSNLANAGYEDKLHSKSDVALDSIPNQEIDSILSNSDRTLIDISEEKTVDSTTPKGEMYEETLDSIPSSEDTLIDIIEESTIDSTNLKDELFEKTLDSIPSSEDTLIDIIEESTIDSTNLKDELFEKTLDSIPSSEDTLIDIIEESTIDSTNLKDELFEKTLDSIPLPNAQPNAENPLLNNEQLEDSLSTDETRSRRKRRFRPYIKPMDSVTISDYLIMFSDNRKFSADTTLQIEDNYKFNTLRTDYFEILPLPNMGQGFNFLGHDFTKLKINPSMGALNKHHTYFEREDIPYFHLPSPLTELFFKTTFEQGHFLDAQLSMNTSPKFNMYIGFKGFRSLGKYVSSRAASSQFRFSSQYQNYSKKFRFRVHYTTQLIENQVNGGLSSDADYFYINAPLYPQADNQGNPVLDENGEFVIIEQDEFLDRKLLITNIEGNNNLGGKRIFFEPVFRFFKKDTDSDRFGLEVGYNYTQENKYYDFSVIGSPTFFGQIVEELGQSNLLDRNDYDTTDHQLFGRFDLGKLGKFKLNVQSLSWEYVFAQSTTQDPQTSVQTPEDSSDSPNNMMEPTMSDENNTMVSPASMGSQTNYRLDWNLDIEKNRFGAFYGNATKKDFAPRHYGLTVSRPLFWGIDFEAKYHFLSRPLDFNYFLYQSFYSDYNWNKSDWKNQNIGTLKLRLQHPKWGFIEYSSSSLENYGYFKSTSGLAEKYNKLIAVPLQTSNPIDYVKIRFSNKLKLGNFSLINTVQFQEISEQKPQSDDILAQLGENALHAPKWLLRSSIVFSTELFNRQLSLNTGINFRFFTDYHANQHNPLLGQFVVQTHTKIGEFPLADIFVNLKVQQTRLFFNLENFGSWFEQRIIDKKKLYDFYSDPLTPYRDSIIRFGLIWNFFQ